jgi:hypothetical protein
MNGQKDDGEGDNKDDKPKKLKLSYVGRERA